MQGPDAHSTRGRFVTATHNDATVRRRFERAQKPTRSPIRANTDINRGQYLDPQLGKKPFDEWAGEWLDARRKEIAPMTFMGYEGLIGTHLEPFFGRTPLMKIRPLYVQGACATRYSRGVVLPT